MMSSSAHKGGDHLTHIRMPLGLICIAQGSPIFQGWRVAPDKKITICWLNLTVKQSALTTSCGELSTQHAQITRDSIQTLLWRRSSPKCSTRLQPFVTLWRISSSKYPSSGLFCNKEADCAWTMAWWPFWGHILIWAAEWVSINSNFDVVKGIDNIQVNITKVYDTVVFGTIRIFGVMICT